LCFGGKVENEKRFLREILDEGFYKLDRALFEIQMQIDKLADRDMLRVDRVDQVRLRQEELSEQIQELDMRVRSLETWSQKSHIIYRHGVSMVVSITVILLVVYWASGG